LSKKLGRATTLVWGGSRGEGGRVENFTYLEKISILNLT